MINLKGFPDWLIDLNPPPINNQQSHQHQSTIITAVFVIHSNVVWSCHFRAFWISCCGSLAVGRARAIGSVTWQKLGRQVQCHSTHVRFIAIVRTTFTHWHSQSCFEAWQHAFTQESTASPLAVMVIEEGGHPWFFVLIPLDFRGLIHWHKQGTWWWNMSQDPLRHCISGLWWIAIKHCKLGFSAGELLIGMVGPQWMLFVIWSNSSVEAGNSLVGTTCCPKWHLKQLQVV